MAKMSTIFATAAPLTYSGQKLKLLTWQRTRTFKLRLAVKNLLLWTKICKICLRFRWYLDFDHCDFGSFMVNGNKASSSYSNARKSFEEFLTNDDGLLQTICYWHADQNQNSVDKLDKLPETPAASTRSWKISKLFGVWLLLLSVEK